MASATPAPASPSPPTAADRLSIYDGPSSPVMLVPVPPSQLQLQISSVRKAAQNVYGDLSTRAREASNNWIGAEHKLEHELSSIRAKDEPLTPGAFYIGISTLFGSILSRNRFLPIRILTPPTFLVASSIYFLPKTTSNALAYTEALEKTYFPSLWAAQSQLQARVDRSIASLRAWATALGAESQAMASASRSRLAQQTGLNLNSAERSDARMLSEKRQ